MGRKISIICFNLTLAVSFALKEAPGKSVVVGNCIVCHSLDYIPMNGFLDKKGWEAEVNKMIHTMGAPISTQDASTIVKYLVENYGK